VAIGTPFSHIGTTPARRASRRAGVSRQLGRSTLTALRDEGGLLDLAAGQAGCDKLVILAEVDYPAEKELSAVAGGMTLIRPSIQSVMSGTSH